MAPRGRPKKRAGQTRMDAAIDALVPLGFTKNVIRRKVNELLKVYDGEWKFFEEGSYQGLIEVIIADQEKVKTEMDEDSASDRAEASCAGGDAKPSDAPDDAEPSDTKPPLIGTSTEAPSAGGDAKPSDAPDDAEPSDTKLPLIGTSTEAPFTCTTTELVASTLPNHGTIENVSETGVTQVGWKDISCTDVGTAQASVMEPANNDGEVDNEIGRTVENVPQGALGGVPLRKRKPCYGWISSDNDEEDCIFFPTEATQRVEMQRSMAPPKERKRRWDVMQKS